LPDGHRFTPLLYAAKNASLNSGIRDQSALCRLLLQHDANPNARDAKGFSPLMWTVPDAKNAAGQIEFARNLLALGALVDATDNEGLTALWWSCHFCEEQHRKSRNNALSCGPYIFLLICRGADADFIPSSIVPNAVMSSPREMLHRCNLHRLLQPEIIAISDDDADATRRCSPSPSSAPVAALAPTSPTGTASPVVSVAAKRSMPYEDASVSFPQAQVRKCIPPDTPSVDVEELQLEKRNVKMLIKSLQTQLKEGERKLACVKAKLLKNDTLHQVVIKEEKECSDSDNSSGRSSPSVDRWVHSCVKCGQLGELLCCQHPGCRLAFHPQCVFFHSAPEGRWVCDRHKVSSKVSILPSDATSAKNKKKAGTGVRGHRSVPSAPAPCCAWTVIQHPTPHTSDDGVRGGVMECWMIVMSDHVEIIYSCAVLV
jgi:hypothetical protein